MPSLPSLSFLALILAACSSEPPAPPARAAAPVAMTPAPVATTPAAEPQPAPSATPAAPTPARAAVDPAKLAECVRSCKGDGKKKLSLEDCTQYCNAVLQPPDTRNAPPVELSPR